MNTSVQNIWPQYRPYIIGGGLLVLTVTGLLIWHHYSKKEDEFPQTRGSEKPSTVPTQSRFCQSRDYPLRHRNCHLDVKILQRALLALGANLGNYGPNGDGIDGDFGDLTLAAVKSKFGKNTISQADMVKIRLGLKRYAG